MIFLSTGSLFAQADTAVSAQATSVLLSRAREMLAEGSPAVLLPYLQQNWLASSFSICGP